MGIEQQHLVTARLQQRLRVAMLERKVGIATAEIDAAFERPARIEQSHSHAGTVQISGWSPTGASGRISSRIAGTASSALRPLPRASDAGRAGPRSCRCAPPAREPLELRRVGHVIALIAWAPVGEADRRHRDVQLGKARQQLEQAHGVARAAPRLNTWPASTPMRARARMYASTASSMYSRSRTCLPSP